MTCFYKHNRGQNNSSWKGGISYEPYGLEFNSELKELIRKRDDYKCRSCQAPQEEFIQALAVHHIDENKRNNNPDNLIALCKYCHGKLHYSKDKERMKCHIQ